MEDPASSVVIGVRTPHDTYHRKVLAVGTGDGVEHTQASDGEGDNACSDTAGPSVAISGVAGVELVAASNEVEPGLGEEVVEQGEVEVAGNGEDVIDAELDQTASQVTAESGLGGVESDA